MGQAPECAAMTATAFVSLNQYTVGNGIPNAQKQCLAGRYSKNPEVLVATFPIEHGLETSEQRSSIVEPRTNENGFYQRASHTTIMERRTCTSQRIMKVIDMEAAKSREPRKDKSNWNPAVQRSFPRTGITELLHPSQGLTVTRS